MTEPTGKNNAERVEVDPLPTRHVFLDTQAYRQMGHDARHELLQRLGERVKEHKIVLHTTDLTLREIERQIGEDAEAKVRDLERAARSVGRLQKRSNEEPVVDIPHVDADALASSLYDRFRSGLHSYGVKEHAAFDVSPKDVFDAYFARRAPFDRTDAKEFPDAFMIEALRSWCERKDEEMVVVTHDKAMGRAAGASERLHLIKDVKSVLASSAIEFDAEIDQEIERLLGARNFDDSFEMAMETAVADMPFAYVGDGVSDGEVYEGSHLVVSEVTDWTPVSLGTQRAAVILRTEFEVEAEITYEDRSGAWYDKEDGVWFGLETTTATVHESVVANVLTEIRRKDGTVLHATILKPEIEVVAPDLEGF